MSLLPLMSPAKHSRDCSCDKETLDVEMKAELCAMVHEPDPERHMAMVGAFLEDNISRIKRLLSTVARNVHLPYNRKDDLISYLGDAVIKLTSDIWRKKPRQFDQMGSPAYILELRTREILREERLHGLSGDGAQFGSPAQRKKMDAVEKSRDRFLEQKDRMPTLSELRDFHNERMYSTRANPKKQGVLVTLDDLRSSAEPVSLDDDTSTATEIPVSDQYDESEAERSAIIGAILRECDDKDMREDLKIASQSRKPKRRKPRYGDIARIFYRRHSEGHFPTKEDVVHELGLDSPEDVIPAREVGRRLAEVHEMSRDAFSDMLER